MMQQKRVGRGRPRKPKITHGQRLKSIYGSDFYSKIGKKGGAALWRKIRAGKI